MPSSIKTPPSILIIEDEAILALDLCMQLEAEGYAIAGTAATGAQAIALFQQEPVDLVMCDIQLRNGISGIETARQLTSLRPVPIIYLSALTDRATLEQAKNTHPAAYLTKPVTTASMRVAIEIALSNFTYNSTARTEHTLQRDGETILQVGDYIFIKQNYQYVRVPQNDVLYIEAEDKYTTVVTTGRKFVLRLPLGVLLQRLSGITLVRVHRSYAVNLARVESFSDYEVQVPGQTMPLGRAYKDEFFQQFMHR